MSRESEIRMALAGCSYGFSSRRGRCTRRAPPRSSGRTASIGRAPRAWPQASDPTTENASAGLVKTVRVGGIVRRSPLPPARRPDGARLVAGGPRRRPRRTRRTSVGVREPSSSARASTDGGIFSIIYAAAGHRLGLALIGIGLLAAWGEFRPGGGDGAPDRFSRRRHARGPRLHDRGAFNEPHQDDRRQPPRYMRRTSGSTRSAAAGASRRTSPRSSTRPRSASSSAFRAFCSTSRMVVPARRISARVAHTSRDRRPARGPSTARRPAAPPARRGAPSPARGAAAARRRGRRPGGARARGGGGTARGRPRRRPRRARPGGRTRPSRGSRGRSSWGSCSGPGPRRRGPGARSSPGGSPVMASPRSRTAPAERRSRP